MSKLLERPAVEPAPASPQRSAVPLYVLGLLMVAYALLFGWMSLREYWGYSMHALDMGNMAQAAWNTIHGRPFVFTNMYPLYSIEAWGTTTRLSFHVEYLYPLIALVYLVYPGPESLLLLQTLAIAAGAIPVYLLGRELVGRWLAVVLAGAYLLFPAVEGMNLYEFHPVSLATPLLLFAFYCAWRRRYGLFALAAFGAMGTKEQIGLVVAMFGLYIAVVNRDRLIGLGTFVVGVGWSLFAAVIVEAHFRTPGTTSYLHTRYGYLLQGGHGFHSVLHTLLHNPAVFWPVLATWPKAGFIAQLSAPLGFLPFAGAPLLALCAPSFLLDLLSADSHMYSALGDNSAELIAVVVIASCFGAAVLVRGLAPYTRRAAWAVAGLVALSALWSQHVDGFTPLGPRFQVVAVDAHQTVQQKFVSMVPAGAPVSTSDVLDPHLSSRRWVYLFPLMGPGGTPNEERLAPAQDVLLDVSTPVYPIHSDGQEAAAMSVIRRPGWGVVAARDGLILIARGARSKVIPRSFYSFLNARGAPAHRVHLSAGGLSIVGYDVAKTDLANYRIPELAYSVYLRVTGKVTTDLQPVVYDLIDGKPIGCSADPLGLAWRPTGQWVAGETYVLHMQPLETQWDGAPTVAQLALSLQPRKNFADSCGAFWGQRGPLVRAGTLTISY